MTVTDPYPLNVIQLPSGWAGRGTSGLNSPHPALCPPRSRPGPGLRRRPVAGVNSRSALPAEGPLLPTDCEIDFPLSDSCGSRSPWGQTPTSRSGRSCRLSGTPPLSVPVWTSTPAVRHPPAICPSVDVHAGRPARRPPSDPPSRSVLRQDGRHGPPSTSRPCLHVGPRTRRPHLRDGLAPFSLTGSSVSSRTRPFPSARRSPPWSPPARWAPTPPRSCVRSHCL